MRQLCLGLLSIGMILGLWACATSRPGHQSSQARVPLPSVANGAVREYPGLHNVVAYHDGYLSGSMPEGDAGFDALAAMGVKTIISVDGAVPDVARARVRGMRYIHLPIGYNGFDDARKLELVRASRDGLRDGVVYVHCHHGKHRSAGAAATVAASLGWMTPDEGVARMKVSGTAANYTGLFACAQRATVLGAREVDAVDPNFPTVSRPTRFVEAMVEIDTVVDHLKQIEQAGWVAPKEHPDLVPVAEAGRLADLYRVLSTGSYAQRKPAEFAAMLRTDSDRAQAIEDGLGAATVDGAALSKQFKLIVASCKDCHAVYRDPPVH